jgi:hypothetical protein
MNSHAESITCNCHSHKQENDAEKLFATAGKTTRSLPSVLMSILIAFFPKCPICWAVYMSMLGSIGLAKLPYMPWLFPVLLVLLCFHLFMLYRKATQKGYLPLVLSVAGAAIILTGRSFFPLQTWLVIPGMALVISGSLLNSFLAAKPQVNRLAGQGA